MEYEIQYNGKSIGKLFKTIAEARKEFNRLWNLNLYGYTINKL